MKSMKAVWRIGLSILALSLLVAWSVGSTSLISNIAQAQNGQSSSSLKVFSEDQAQQAQADWATDWSKKLGLSLLASFDSSGPAAWDAKAHPVVFITTEGPGYAGQLSKTNTKPGIAIIDAVTRQVVASQQYELEGVKPSDYFEPHGLGVSGDGRWIYLPTGTSAGFGEIGSGRLLIIDAKTLKLSKVLSTPTNAHHAEAFTNAQGKSLVLAYGFSSGNYYVLDPKDDNKVVGGILNNDLQGNGYLGFVDLSGKYMLASVRPPTGLVDAPGFVAVVDTQTWKVVRNVSVRDSSPIWVSFTADGKNAYVSGGHESLVIKLNIEGAPSRWSVVGMSRAGVEGPYGINLNWDETQIWTHGKGEGSHNLGITMGLTNPKLMVDSTRAIQAVGEYYTACLRNDHGAVHPDPKLNELWLSCNSSFEVVVFDMAKKEVKARIPLPNGGSTHSGSFVRYTVDDQGNWTGEVQSDQNGLQGSALAEKKKILGIK